MSCHPIQRAKERYGLDLEMKDIFKIKDMIKDKRPYHINVTEDGQEDYILLYKSTRILVRYNPEKNRLITFLTLKG